MSQTLTWTEAPCTTNRRFMVSVPLIAHGPRTAATMLLSSRAARRLAEDLMNAADDADVEEDQAALLDGIDSGDLDANGDFIPMPTYRAA